MRSARYLGTAAVVLLAVTAAVAGSDPEPEALRAAVQRAIPVIEKSSAEYTRQRGCFACHHQAMAVVALTAARERGFAVDEANLRHQLEFTEASLRGARENYRQGKGQGGQVDTAGYALLALSVGGWKAEGETTETPAAVTEYLLRRDADVGHWRVNSSRPPSERSPFTSTALALRGLKAFGTPEQQERIAARVTAAREWLLNTPARDTEDRVFRLRGLKSAGATDDAVRGAAEELKRAQGDDGGWSQDVETVPPLASDAYATGSALVALHAAGGMAVDDPVYRRGLAFLVRTQEPDGSWHVVTRSKPIQVYFESGFPHGKDQFISMAGTCWATAALAEACPPGR